MQFVVNWANSIVPVLISYCGKMYHISGSWMQGIHCIFIYLWLFYKLKFTSKQNKNFSQGHSSSRQNCFAWFQSLCFFCSALLPPSTLPFSELAETGLGHSFQVNYFMGKIGGTIRHKPVHFKWGKWGTGSLKCTQSIFTLSSRSHCPDLPVYNAVSRFPTTWLN